MKTPNAPRGNALLITIVALAVLMILVVGAINFTGTNRISAGSKLSADRVASCAEAAKRAVLAEIAGGSQAMTLSLTKTLMDDATPSKQTKWITGHYDGTAIKSLVPLPASTFSGSDEMVGGMSNRVVAKGIGIAYYRVVMTCAEPLPTGVPAALSRQSEIEFLFRYGY